MKLFRQLLLGLFPQSIREQQMNPANMFVSFVSPKQFFSVISRKAVENFKLNLFDIGLDPFDAKVGFGEQPTLNVKDVDFYYAYNAAANLNGWTFYSPGNIGIALSVVMALMTTKVFKKEDHMYQTTFLVTVYLCAFIFAARLKVFPYTDKEKNYAWFIDVFFNAYRTTLLEAGYEVDDRVFGQVKMRLLQDIHLFFMLFYIYKRLNGIFYRSGTAATDFYRWLFPDTTKLGSRLKLMQDYIDNGYAYSKLTHFSNDDIRIMKTIFPADVLIKYLFQGKDTPLIIEKVLAQLFDTQKLTDYVHQFLQGDDHLVDFLSYIMDWKVWREHYFSGIRELTRHKFTLQQDFATSQKIDSFISSLEEVNSLDNVEVPDVLKQEGMMMDRLVNFYVTYMGGMRIARGDNFALRVFQPDLVATLMQDVSSSLHKEDTMLFYGALLYNYTKNIFYYTYAYEHIKAGHETFQLPLKSASKDITSNAYVLSLFDESFFYTLLQDLNKKRIKIYVQHTGIIDQYKHLFGSDIRTVLAGEEERLIAYFYAELPRFLQSGTTFLTHIQDMITDEQRNALKEQLYCFDVQLYNAVLSYLHEHEVLLHTSYDDRSIIGIFAQIKETCFGVLLWYTYILTEQQTADIDMYADLLVHVYIADVLGIGERYQHIFGDMLKTLAEQYSELLTMWIQLDDNPKYFALGAGNWVGFIEKKDPITINHEITGEDIIRFRGYLKTITYYNKRYLIPTSSSK